MSLIRLIEVGPRDGLQNEPNPIPTEAKVAFVEALSRTGLKEIEVSSFVSPKRVPQLADAEEVFRRIRRVDGVVYSALVPNRRGLDRALAAGVDKIAVFTAASETFNRNNVGCSIEDSIRGFGPVLDRAGLPARAYVSMAFWCPFEGKIPPERVVALAHRLADLGANEIAIGDTTGKATAAEVRKLLDALLPCAAPVAMHFHDTFGHAVENALVAWKEYGVAAFDGSAGGLGGCPFAPGAPGNVATEALARAFAAAGAKTGVKVAAVRRAVAILEPHREVGTRPER
jgi:hydroxymethylglutaryl-CoA lyase